MSAFDGEIFSFEIIKNKKSFFCASLQEMSKMLNNKLCGIALLKLNVNSEFYEREVEE
jgi:hypothetical protein